MKIKCLYDKLVPISDVKPHPKNRNIHPPEQIVRLAQILDYQGWRYPVKVSRLSGFVTSGHGRIEAARKNGWTEIPVNYQEYESEAQEYADVQADNAIASWAELDLSGINTDALELGPEFDINLLGIKDFELIEPKEEPGSDEDDVPEPEEAIVKLGDIWKLGNHRLMCGDSTSIDAVEKLMAGEKADMVFTDPPYGMNLNPNYSEYMAKISEMEKNSTVRTRKSYKPVIGDNKDFDPGIILGIFHDVDEVYLWGADYYCQVLPKSGSWLVWDKTGGSESLDKAGFQSKFELCWSKSPHRRRILRSTWVGVCGMSHKDDVNRVHPTQKPVKVCEQVIKEIKAENVVDLYGGSGSTLIACEKTNRKCYMMEIEPHYNDVIIARWEKYTNKKAELLNGQEAE